MIPFLVKLANILDDRGQHKMAREVDDLIEKLAQQVNKPYVSPEELIRRYQEAERAHQEAIAEQKTAKEALETSSMANREAAQQKLDAANARYNETWTARDRAKKELDEDSQAALARMQSKTAPQTDMAAKQVAKPVKKVEPNPLVAEIQRNLGVKETGHWNPETNKKFIAVMNSQPEYAKMMEGGKFKGTLQQAVQLTSQLASLKEMDKQPQPQQGVASKAPAAVKQEDDSEVPPRNGPFGGPGPYGR